MARIGRTLLALLLGLAAALAVTPGSAHAGVDLCGATITADTTLTQDQSCTGHGIIIGASGITLDLNGFTIDGDDSGIDYGVHIQLVDDITVKNGTIQDFRHAVRVRVADHVTLYDLSLRSSTDDGIDAELARWLTLHKVRASDNAGKGVDIGNNSHRFTIKRSQFSGNGLGGLETSESDHGLVTKSRANSNMEVGFVVNDNVDGVVSHNKADGNREEAFEFNDADHMRITHNLATDTTGGDGFDINNIDDSLFRKNVAKDNGDDGFDFEDGSDDNTVQLNKAIGSDEEGFEFSSRDGNDIRANVAKKNDGQGFLWKGGPVLAVAGAGDAPNGGPRSGEAGGYGGGRSLQGFVTLETNYFISNISLKNGDDGFGSSQPGVVFRKNVAGKNDDFGIYAPNATNGQIGYTTPANLVFGNGNSPQCSPGVACAVLY